MNDKPDHQRPEKPDFWDKRFIEGVTPWNAGKAPAALVDFASRCDGRPRTLIPGCGHAWEAGWLARLGWQVTALDFSPAAIAAARELLGNWPGELRCDDFFTYAPAAPFDIVYERAFLCALPRRLWSGYGARMHALIAPGGCIAYGITAQNSVLSAHCASSGAKGCAAGNSGGSGCRRSITRAASAVSQYRSAPICSTGVRR